MHPLLKLLDPFVVLFAQDAGDAAAGGFFIAIIGCYCFAGLLGVASFAMWIWMLIDCLTKEPDGSEKTTWIIVLVLTSGLGAILYYFIRRPKRIAEHGQ